MRERCIKVALENTPSNVRCVRIRKDLGGLAETSGPDAGLLCAPRPITRRALYVYLHECAHFVLHTGEKHGELPRYAEEYEAEQWAHKVMRAAGIPVPRAETRQAKENIAYLLRRVKRKKGAADRSAHKGFRQINSMENSGKGNPGKSRSSWNLSVVRGCLVFLSMLLLSVKVIAHPAVVVIDPGHGGIDRGGMPGQRLPRNRTL